MKKLLMSLMLVALLAACSQGVVEEGNSETAAPAQTTQDPVVQDPAAADPHAGVSVPKERTISVPKEVSEKYKSLIIEVKNLTENSSVQTDVLIGQKSEVTGTPFEVLVEYYLPDFVIEADGTITTRSAEENNPVAKIKVFKFGEVYFDGWLFQNHPDEHGSFEDQAYSMTLVKSVTK
ncbi:conserved hypothetical protein [Denitrovibrio acetiphilus DSM 12809]|jgi:hypothetical protein|uniref:Lipoprotein n=1 Tax=Denitrovibrio acetiphilus (strain DSM 12809 / NBRC 114555 / N2460) TaxID=522772 RepID=D4H3D3_DENA2|nr:hypothetical protein [Denitrovibrio acetiphilus]ADD67217.1 conserved hypothetical protein [Denitrovibrio acetiphilus DSM 12809]